MMIKNINSLNEKFGINIAVKSLPPKLKDQYLAFRINFLIEELQELQVAHVNKNPEGVVDALIDLIYVALGTLNTLEIDTQKAWDRVHFANMLKEPGENKTRKNSFNLRDLIKPKDWKEPYHKDNIGMLGEIYNETKK